MVCFAMINGTSFITCEKTLNVKGYSKSKEFLESVCLDQRYLYCADTNPEMLKCMVDDEAGKTIDFGCQITALRSTFDDFLTVLNRIVRYVKSGN